MGGKHGIYILERDSGKLELLKRFYDSEERDDRLRSNDGAVDPQGRFWIGTMNDFHVGAPQAEGEFFPYLEGGLFWITSLIAYFDIADWVNHRDESRGFLLAARGKCGRRFSHSVLLFGCGVGLLSVSESAPRKDFVWSRASGFLLSFRKRGTYLLRVFLF